MNEIVKQTVGRLGPISEAISVYDKSRPLNGAAREIQGLTGAWEILWAEVGELVEVRQLADAIPVDKLNGHRRWLGKELGDVGFDLAEVTKYLPISQMNSNQLAKLSWICGYARETEIKYGLNLVVEGVGVNYGKNRKNNPQWTSMDHHPLDRDAVVVEKNYLVRKGLRNLRDLSPEGELLQENLSRALGYFGYSLEVVKESPSLATAFWRQVAINGVDKI